MSSGEPSVAAPTPIPASTPEEDYCAKIGAELERYAEQEEVHDLPAIYHFWSERYCVPLFKEVGFAGLYDFLDVHVAEQCARRAPERTRLVSLGAGNGDTEIGIAERLRQRGIENLELVLLELNPQMLERAMADARRHGIEDRVVAIQMDLNEWRAQATADVYFANHSLHHVVALENVFAEVAASLHPEGVLLVNDMIGRNGHVRWPEAADLVNRVWNTVPERYRWNRFQRSLDEAYPDIDCSTSGFEGVRAQDILPLLLERFHPDVYIAFLNVADPFIDRVYGPNLDTEEPEDLAFVDALGRLDDAAVDLGLVTPTHLVASFRMRPVPCRYPRARSPRRTLRPTDGSNLGDAPPAVDGTPPAAGDAPSAPSHASETAELPLICWPLDHYYSPIANTRALSREPARSRVWPSAPPATPGLDWRGERQVALLRDRLARQSGFSIPDGPTGDPHDYHAASEMFSRLDAWVLQAMLRHFRPRRVVEVGCGWSSLVSARVNREYFAGQIDFTCIEPYPPDFLGEGIEGISRLIVAPVEQVPVELFGELGANDVLFIDTSHTVKTGGDVVFLLQEVLPRLAAGVVVHIHDIFLPWDYPQDWVLAGRAWNEQYAVRAFLTFNSAFEILLGVGWMSHFQPDTLAAALPDYPQNYPDGGGSLWIRRMPGAPEH